MNWSDFLTVMAVDERAARAKYKTAARSATDPAIKEMFQKLAYEEEVHLGVLQRFKENLKSALAQKKVNRG